MPDTWPVTVLTALAAKTGATTIVVAPADVLLLEELVKAMLSTVNTSPSCKNSPAVEQARNTESKPVLEVTMVAMAAEKSRMQSPGSVVPLVVQLLGSKGATTLAAVVAAEALRLPGRPLAVVAIAMVATTKMAMALLHLLQAVLLRGPKILHHLPRLVKVTVDMAAILAVTVTLPADMAKVHLLHRLLACLDHLEWAMPMAHMEILALHLHLLRVTFLHLQ